ncbi:amino acid adenylation domain-containing protein [Catenulispora sp. GAS73]|uniref:amino acid adenylation domain-containing protein n=1 Tax=Catenulispora sp. GAS73 TaxID=3156269 RepID=UPI003515B4CA
MSVNKQIPVAAAGTVTGRLRLLAARDPGRAAVRVGADVLSRGALDRLTDRLAARLAAAGVRPGDVVAVARSERLHQVAGMLAVWKAGGVYLPVDPEWPAERAEMVLADSGAVFTLDETVLEASAFEITGADSALDQNSATPSENPDAAIDPAPDTLAYLIYTSGSTGRPKAVAVAHRALARHIDAVSERFGIGEADTVLNFAKPTADVAVEQVLTALAAGGCLVLPENGLMSVEEFWRLIDAGGVTVANLPSGYFHALVSAVRDGRGIPATLRTMISGSDRLSPQAAASWVELTGVRLLNAYGPTETVITASAHEVSADPGGEAVPIGTEVAGRVAHVLDDRLSPVAADGVGELYLGGPVIAAGYLGRAELTATRFLPDPFSDAPGARMYRTGDLVRRGEAGLVFVGRTDDQVKIRGFRVELGEVENALAAHPAVATCAVAVDEAPGREARLAAYITAAAPAPGYTEIRDFLADRLPGHLIPASLTVLEELPLTANGKVDRVALPAAAAGGADSDTSHAPDDQAPDERSIPRTPAEELISGIWADVLGVAGVGRGDNFFHLGGDSLTAVRVASRVFEVFGPVSPYLIFDAPTLADYAAAVHGQFTGQDGRNRTAPVRTAAASAPLSPYQRGLWVQDCLQPGTATYNVPWVFEFDGALDAEHLRDALAGVVARHEALRTTFDVADGAGRQIVHPPSAPALRVEDLTGVPEAERRARVEALIRADAQEPFDLQTGPLLRSRLIVESERSASLVLVFHHLIWDEGSLPVLDREVRELYAARSQNRPARLAEPAIQYGDYAAWLDAEGVGKEQLAYWQEQLRDLPTGVAVPPDREQATDPESRLEYQRFDLGAELAAGVRELARSQDATPFMVLLAALVLAVQRRGGEDDLVVATPVSVRDRPELDDLIGYFINLLPLRFRIGPGLPFRDVLAHVRQVALEGYRNQAVPFERVADLARVEPGAARHPLVQLVFEAHTASPAVAPVGGAALSRRLHVNELSRFDLSWSVEDDGTGFTGRVEYDAGLFDASTPAALAADWTAVLAAVVADPELAVVESAGSPQSGGSPRDPLAEPESPVTARRPAGIDGDLFSVFAEQAARTPSATALAFGEMSITYAALAAAAARVATTLVQRGVAAGDLVAVTLPRGVDMVMALLGALKAGAGYVLIDPELPAGRRAAVLTDTAPALIVDEELVAHDPGPAPTEHVAVDPESVACLMFTSGSTGRPKGVAVSHRALLATYLGQKYAAFDASQVWLQCSPVSWDAFALELFGALLHGGTCVLAPGQRPDPQTVAELVARHGVTQLQLSASLFNFLVDELPEAFAGVRLAFTAGEAASPAHAARIRAGYPELVVVNGYGPVESLGLTTSHVIGPDDLGSASVPIGTPLAGKGVRVLDERLRPVPPGVTGELYCTGDGLAHGYLRQPGMTASRFLPDPFSGDPGARMYRTGDLGHVDEAGVLHIAGRADDQVKIRGFRVEPAEVVAGLQGIRGVRQAAVTVVGTGSTAQLAAWVTGTADMPSPQDMQEQLTGLLPDYMIPTTVTVLPRLPMTANGKLDHAALAARPLQAGPSGEAGGDTASDTADDKAGDGALTDAERLVADVWAEVLGLDAVGTDDTFFRLGGNSLAAVRVAMRLSRRTGTKVPPRLVFSAKTVRALARALPAAQPIPAGTAPGPNQTETR